MKILDFAPESLLCRQFFWHSDIQKIHQRGAYRPPTVFKQPRTHCIFAPTRWQRWVWTRNLGIFDFKIFRIGNFRKSWKTMDCDQLLKFTELKQARNQVPKNYFFSENIFVFFRPKTLFVRNRTPWCQKTRPRRPSAPRAFPKEIHWISRISSLRFNFSGECVLLPRRRL